MEEMSDKSLPDLLPVALLVSCPRAIVFLLLVITISPFSLRDKFPSLSKDKNMFSWTMMPSNFPRFARNSLSAAEVESVEVAADGGGSEGIEDVEENEGKGEGEDAEAEEDVDEDNDDSEGEEDEEDEKDAGPPRPAVCAARPTG